MVERESAWTSLTGVSALLHEASSVSFSFYTKHEVRRLSAVRVTSSKQRDVMNRPLPGGLYDPRMGPTDHYESCVTCGLDYAMCPGHFGHIELPLPAYSPLLFPLLHGLLRCTCRECHHFRAPRARLEPFAACLGLLDAGMLADAAAVLENAHCVKGNSKLGNNEVGDDDEVEPAFMAVVSAEGRRVLRRQHQLAARAGAQTDEHGEGVTPPTLNRVCGSPHLIALRKKVFTALGKALRPGAQRCSRCNKNSGALKVHGGKLFVSSLSQRALASNASLGEGDGPAARGSRSAAPRRGRSAGPAGPTGAGAASSAAAGAAAAGSDDESDSDSDEEEAEETAAGVEAMEVIGEDEAESAEASFGKAMFLNPWQAKKEAYELWGEEGDLLRRLYPAITPASFFTEVCVVPPNRFRPPAKVGDQLFDHSQNVWLGKIVTAMETLHRIKAQWEEQEAGGGAAAEPPADAVVTASTLARVIPPMTDQRMMERYMAAWDEMCQGVACIVDSSKDDAAASPNAQVPAGVKQMLERKAGLFRSHMMGKRVNFCCRSVISPDVNLGTHEIGVPLHFATELTFPEAVTPWNVKELRRAVVNGPTQHPGANFVQDARGEMIDLSRRSRPQRVAIAARLLADADGGGAGSGGALLGSTLGDLASLSTCRAEADLLLTKGGKPVLAGATGSIFDGAGGGAPTPAAGSGRSNVSAGCKKVRHPSALA